MPAPGGAGRNEINLFLLKPFVAADLKHTGLLRNSYSKNHSSYAGCPVHSFSDGTILSYWLI